MTTYPTKRRCHVRRTQALLDLAGATGKHWWYVDCDLCFSADNQGSDDLTAWSRASYGAYPDRKGAESARRTHLMFRHPGVKD